MGWNSTIIFVLFIAFLGLSNSEGDDEAAIKKVVLEAQRAGAERGDLKSYLQQWTDDAQIIGGRGDKKGKYDVVLNRKQIEATRGVRYEWFKKNDIKLKLEFSDIKINVNEDKAVMSLVTKVKYDEGYEAVRENYNLRRTKAGWRVYRNRYWSHEFLQNGEVLRFDADRWKLLDEKVTKAKRLGDALEIAATLFDAQRWPEAYEILKKHTDSADDVKPDEWEWRAHAALLSGDADDARKAFARAENAGQ